MQLVLVGTDSQVNKCIVQWNIVFIAYLQQAITQKIKTQKKHLRADYKPPSGEVTMVTLQQSVIILKQPRKTKDNCDSILNSEI